MTSEILTKLEEIAASKGKTLLIENFQVRLDSKYIQVEKLEEKILITEANTGEKFTAFAVLRNVPVTRFVENLNGRIYPKALWERVQKEKFAEGTLCLCDHPKDEGSTKDIAGVWHNFKVMLENGVSDLYLVGEHGKRLLETVQAGGPAGMSSVGYGEFLEDRKTVNPNTYELERMSDWVMKPSQQVYATYEQVGIDFNTNKIEEKITKEKSNTNKLEEQRGQEIDMPESQIEKLMEGVVKLNEKQYSNQLNSLITAAKQENADLKTIREEVIAISNEATDFPKITEKANTEITNIEKLIQIKEDEHKAHVDKLTETNKLLNESLSQVSSLLKEIQESLEVEVKEGEDISLKEALMAKVTEIKEDIQTALLNEADMQNDINCLLEDLEFAKNDVEQLKSENKELKEDSEAMLDDIKCFKEENTLLKEDVGLLRTGIEKIMPFKEFMDNVMDPNKDLDGMFDMNNPGKDSKMELSYATDDGNMEYESKYDSTYKSMRSEYDSYDKMGKSIVENPTGPETDSNQSFKPASQAGGENIPVEAEKVPMSKDIIIQDKINVAASAVPFVDPDYIIESAPKVEEVPKRTVDPKKAFPITEAVKEATVKGKFDLGDFFSAQVEKYPFLADHKKEILKSTSLMEAIQKIDALKEEEKEVITTKKTTLSESKEDWLRGRR